MTDEIKPKKSILKKWWFWLIIVFVIFALIAIAGEDKDKEPTPEPEQVEDTSEPVEDTEEPKPKIDEQDKDEKPEPLPAKEWIKVINLTANANKQSETFQLKGGQQKVLYTVSDDPSGICAIYVMKEGTDLMTHGGFPIVMAEEGSTDETMMRKSKGSYYLDLMVANASCVVEIYEFR